MRLLIATTALQKIASTIRLSDPRLETGGALFGPPDGSRVMHAAGPGPLAEHAPRFFRRDLTFTKQEAERLYREDSSQWIGEWHTHVDVSPAPSKVDLNTYIRHIADRDLGFARFVALIIGTTRIGPVVAAWVLEREGDDVLLTHAGSEAIDLGAMPPRRP